MPAKNPVSIYQLKVTLKDIRPPIWRRIQVKEDTTLYKLHQIIQLAMGWTNSHLHQFIADGVYYGEPHPDFGFEVVNEKRTRLNQIMSNLKDKFVYEYDFGDSWEHEIVLENILEPETKTRYPRCIKGKRNCPPEDVGGVWGYSNFLEAIHNKDHPEHEEYLEWIGDSFDPEEFCLEDVNQELKQKR
jgi:hypothetical protein